MKRLREVESLLTVEVRLFGGEGQAAECLQHTVQNIEQGRDKALARYTPELRAAAHLWPAAHRARDPALAAVLVAHVEDACRVLKGMVPAAAPRLSAAGKEKVVEEKVVEEKGRRGARTTRAAAGAKAGVGRR